MVDKEKEIIQWDNWLLEAVRKIRTQKQRPGLDRIYNAVRLLAEKHELAEHSQKSPIAPIYHVQFNQIKIEQVQRHLDRAVRKGLLLKVFSKGQATYKAVEKSERTLNLAKEQSGDNGNNGNGELSKCILKVIRELSECDAPVPTSSSVTVSSLSKPPKLGYTFDTIEEYIRHSHVIIYPDDSQPDFFPSLVRQALGKECSRGKLELVSGEYYRLPPEKHGAASHGNTSSGGSKTKTSTSTNPAAASSSCISSSSNSNSSWSSTTSSNAAAAAASAPTTFSGISPSVSKVKSAATTSSSSAAALSASSSQGTSLIKKDSSSASGSVSATSGKTKGKDSTASLSSASTTIPSSPPRGNLAGDLLTEAEEIALVTEQTARAVMLVMKDRRPGEKPVQKKSSPPPPEVIAHQHTAPSKSPPTAQQQDVVESEKKQSSSGASSSDENSSGNGASRRDSLTGGDSSGNNGGNGNGASGGNGKNGTNGNKGSAVIKLMVPSFPGRNNNGNGNGGNGKNGNGGNGTNPSGTSGTSSKPPSPSQGEGLATATTPSASQSESDKKCKTVTGNMSGIPATEVAMAQSNNDGSPAASSAVGPSTTVSTTAKQSTSATAATTKGSSGGALSISSIASAIMNKSFGKKSTKVESEVKNTVANWTTKGICVICGIKATSKIVRDMAFTNMVQQYFSVLGVDVKPGVCSNADLCSECFSRLADLNETQEILLYFEKYAEGLRLGLLKKTLNMMADKKVGRKRESDSVVEISELGWINQKIKKIHMDNRERLAAEEENVKLVLSRYKVNISRK